MLKLAGVLCVMFLVSQIFYLLRVRDDKEDKYWDLWDRYHESLRKPKWDGKLKRWREPDGSFTKPKGMLL